MDRTSEDILLDLRTVEAMIRCHRERLGYYDTESLKLTMELNRARRLEREQEEL